MTRDQRRGARRDGPSTFRCGNCRLDVSYRAPGTAHRNHCPNCLWSRHLDDDRPGDRAAECGSLMEPIAVTVRGDGEWSVRWLSILGSQTVLVLTPTLMITFLIATGVAVLASPTFPRRFGHAALFFALVRTGLALVDWYGGADVAMRIMDMTLIWVVIASVHLMGATRPVQA